jgi:superfamily II DNA or RNA helicase
LIVAHKKQLLRQFYRTYRDFTNMSDLKRRGRTVVKMVSTPEDLDTKADVVLVNYQKFISKYGPARLKEAITGKFGLLIVDEAHMGSASAFAKFINEIDARYRLGLTATPDRKDNRQFIGYALLGPVIGNQGDRHQPWRG